MNARVLLTVVCEARRPHVLANVYADPRGLLVVVERVPVDDLPPAGNQSYVDRKRAGARWEFFIPDDESLHCLATCPCGRDYPIASQALKHEISAKHRRVVLCAIDY